MSAENLPPLSRDLSGDLLAIPANQISAWKKAVAARKAGLRRKRGRTP